ncbi:MAG: bifunctional uridylyltransferase/uridylyl-removing protein, partial [Gluconacetobacter diazotrophicus]|nr:bifunctional uridylyltransferase/uridylyl-removing protein [Gluconacetobacter diazotrophicus]
MLTTTSLVSDPEAADRLLDTLLARPAGAPALGRGEVLAAFRRHLARVQQSVRDEFESHGIAGEAAARALARLVDGLIRRLHAHVRFEAAGEAFERARSTANAWPALCVVATGGYGRGTLAPFSDIDLLFLTGDAPEPVVLEAVEFTLYFLWDLGLKVGHATRSVAECLAEAAADSTVRTALLDARRVAGDETLFAEFHARSMVARVEAGAAGFVADKQREREARHARYGESPFLVEPNIKEGRGALRDLQTLYWMARYVLGTQSFSAFAKPAGGAPALLTEQEAARARRAWDFLWSVRFHLHYVAGRAEERLTFDTQPVVGARMGYTRHGRQNGVERFMRHYFLTAREV